MNSYEFVLNFSLPQRDANPEEFLDKLFEAGCDDALVGIGKFGLIGLDFTRSAPSAEEALRSAIRDVQQAIPEANLVQVGPDLVGLTDVADIFECSRQNIRKYATETVARRPAFPLPVIIGEPSLWHLAEIVSWFNKNTAINAPPNVLEISKAAAQMNYDVGKKRIDELA